MKKTSRQHTLRSSRPLTLFAIALTCGIASQATAQIHSDTYLALPSDKQRWLAESCTDALPPIRRWGTDTTYDYLYRTLGGHPNLSMERMASSLQWQTCINVEAYLLKTMPKVDVSQMRCGFPFRYRQSLLPSQERDCVRNHYATKAGKYISSQLAKVLGNCMHLADPSFTRECLQRRYGFHRTYVSALFYPKVNPEDLLEMSRLR